MKNFTEELDRLWERAQTFIIGKVRQNKDLIKVDNDELNFNLDGGRWLDCLTPMNIVDNEGYEYGYGVLSHEQIMELADWVETLKQSNSKPTEKSIEDIIEIIEQSWGINEYEEDNDLLGYEINTYTSGGVNQIVFVDFRDTGLDPKNATHFLSVFEKRINEIDIDDEIVLHREMKGYKDAFTLKESISDFEEWKEELERLLNRL